MKICLDATFMNENLWPLVSNEPVALVKLAGKFLIEYILESCVRSKIKSVIIVGGQHCDALRNKLGTGRKWGMDITYKDTIQNTNDLIIINVNALYNINLPDLINMSIQDRHGLINGKIIMNNYQDVSNDVDDTYLQSGLAADNYNKILSIYNHESYYDACMKLVNSELKECVIDPHQFGYKVIEGSRVFYNQENITDGYAYIGDRTRISPTSTLSSDVIIGADVVIDDYAQINHSIIMDNTYIGKMLKVDKSIVKGSYLISIRNKSCTKIKDNILINDFHVKSNNKGFMQRIVQMATPAV